MLRYYIEQKFGKIVKNKFDKIIEFGRNIKILIIVVELNRFGDLVKFAKLFSHQSFVLYGMCLKVCPNLPSFSITSTVVY